MSDETFKNLTAGDSLKRLTETMNSSVKELADRLKDVSGSEQLKQLSKALTPFEYLSRDNNFIKPRLDMFEDPKVMKTGL